MENSTGKRLNKMPREFTQGILHYYNDVCQASLTPMPGLSLTTT